MPHVIPLSKTKSNPGIPPAEVLDSLGRFRTALIGFLKGKDALVDALVCAMLSSNHVLLEDVPGVGKTTVIKAIARMLGLEMRRIQCTSDLLPSDITGVEVFHSPSNEFVFHKGPIFSNIVLADELNRASPRTQSALLEAMGEGYVTVDRNSFALPKPFILFAAQNPSDHLGTYPLPESQLDRFAVKLALDYPAADKEREIFSLATLDPVKNLPHSVLPPEHFDLLQAAVETIFISDRIADYVKRFVDCTRQQPTLKRGVSTRGGVTWLRVARARALLLQRDYITPDDLIVIAPACLSHRIVPKTGNDPEQVIANLLNTVDIE